VGNKNPLPTLQDIIFWINGGQQKPVTHPTGYFWDGGQQKHVTHPTGYYFLDRPKGLKPL